MHERGRDLKVPGRPLKLQGGARIVEVGDGHKGDSRARSGLIFEAHARCQDDWPSHSPMARGGAGRLRLDRNIQGRDRLVVELTETEEIFTAPQHPYAATLLSAVSEPDPRVRSRRIFLEGEWQIPSASSPGEVRPTSLLRRPNERSCALTGTRPRYILARLSRADRPDTG